jgi:8-oxo-dGTP pyrophosphatase MutT (NUDIX family)
MMSAHAGGDMVRHYTVSAIVLHNDRVLLVEHRKSGTALPPGGHIEPGEDPVQALRREVREEVGIDVEILAEERFSHSCVQVVAPPFTILVIDDVHDPVTGPHTHIDLVYVCRPVTHEVVPATDEIGGHHWVRLDEVTTAPTPSEIPDLVYAAAKYARQF